MKATIHSEEQPQDLTPFLGKGHGAGLPQGCPTPPGSSVAGVGLRSSSMRCLHASTTDLCAERVSGMLVTVPRQPCVLPTSVSSDPPPSPREPQGSTPTAHSEPAIAPPGLTSSC